MCAGAVREDPSVNRWSRIEKNPVKSPAGYVETGIRLLP